jgi:RND family efflux transporter MFP subunit
VTSVDPRFRNDLEAQRGEIDDLAFYDVFDPEGGTSFRMYEVEYLIARELDGRPIDVVAMDVSRRLGIETSADELRQYVGKLHELGFLEEAEPTRPSGRAPIPESDTVVDHKAGGRGKDGVMSVSPMTKGASELSNMFRMIEEGNPEQVPDARSQQFVDALAEATDPSIRIHSGKREISGPIRSGGADTAKAAAAPAVPPKSGTDKGLAAAKAAGMDKTLRRGDPLPALAAAPKGVKPRVECAPEPIVDLSEQVMMEVEVSAETGATETTDRSPPTFDMQPGEENSPTKKVQPYKQLLTHQIEQERKKNASMKIQDVEATQAEAKRGGAARANIEMGVAPKAGVEMGGTPRPSAEVSTAPKAPAQPGRTSGVPNLLADYDHLGSKPQRAESTPPPQNDPAVGQTMLMGSGAPVAPAGKGASGPVPVININARLVELEDTAVRPPTPAAPPTPKPVAPGPKGASPTPTPPPAHANKDRWNVTPAPVNATADANPEWDDKELDSLAIRPKWGARLVLAGAAAVAVAAAAIVFLPHHRKATSADPAPQAAGPAPTVATPAMNVEVLEPQTIVRYYSAAAELHAADPSKSSFPQSGAVAELLPPGQHVKVGDSLAKLNGFQKYEKALHEVQSREVFYQGELQKAEHANKQAAIDHAQKKVEEKRKMIAALQAKYANYVLMSTSEGTIGEDLVKVGDLVAAGQPVVKILQGRLRAEFNLPKAESESLKAGMIVRLERDDKTVADARVEEIDEAEDGKAVVHVEVIEMNVGAQAHDHVRLVRARYENVMQVPAAAVAHPANGHDLLFVVQDGKVREKAVDVVDRDEKVVLVQGIGAGEKVVTSGTAGLVDGAKVP